MATALLDSSGSSSSGGGSNAAALDLVSTRGDHVKMAVRVKVVVYPEDVVAVWVMLAVRYQPLEGHRNTTTTTSPLRLHPN